MPPTSSPRDQSHRHQPTGHRPVRATPNQPASTIHPPPYAMPVVPTSRPPPPHLRPYPQPGRSYSSPSVMPPPPPPHRVIAPPPHTLPQSMTAPTPRRPLPQVSPARPRPIQASASSGLAELANVAVTMPPEPPWRRIHPAVIPDIPNGLPQYPPHSPADSPVGSIRPQPNRLPPVSSMLETPPPAWVPVTRVVKHWITAQDPKIQLSPSVLPATSFQGPSAANPSFSFGQRIASGDSDTTVVPDRKSQDPSPPLSNASTATKKKRRFGDPPEEGDSSPRVGPLANLTLSGPSSPDRAKASRDWHEKSRRMLHPRSVWSPPSPAASLPDEPGSNDGSRNNSESGSRGTGVERSDRTPSPMLLPQTPGLLTDPGDGTKTTLARVRSNNPHNYMLPDLDPNDSQETNSDDIVTPSNSFQIDESPKLKKDGSLPSLISPSWDPKTVVIREEPKVKGEQPQDPDEHNALELSRTHAITHDELPPNVKPLDHPEGKAAIRRI